MNVIKTQLNEVINMKNIKATLLGLVMAASVGMVASLSMTAIDLHQTKVKQCQDSFAGFTELEKQAECRF